MTWILFFVVLFFCGVFFCFFVFVFQDRVSLNSSGCPVISSVDQDGLELRNLPVSASQVLQLKACTTTWHGWRESLIHAGKLQNPSACHNEVLLHNCDSSSWLLTIFLPVNCTIRDYSHSGVKLKAIVHIQILFLLLWCKVDNMIQMGNWKTEWWDTQLIEGFS